MSKRAEVLVDGKGVERVLKVVLCGASEEALRLRAASQEDVLLLWQWANDPVTRRNRLLQNLFLGHAHEASGTRKRLRHQPHGSGFLSGATYPLVKFATIVLMPIRHR